jgi:hypothetical protein
MSLIPTYVKADDGLYYKNPILEDEKTLWVLCFDDDDPPELYYRVNHVKTIEQLIEELKDVGLYLEIIEYNGKMGRCYGGLSKIYESKCYFVKVLAAIPTKMLNCKEGGRRKLPKRGEYCVELTGE